MEGRKRGFTLLEIIITLVISSTLFAGVMPLIFKTITTNRAAKLKLNAYEAAHKELESLRGKAVSDMVNHPFEVYGIPNANGYVTIDKNFEGAEQTDIAIVTSQVTWSFNSKNENISLKTYLYGANQ